MKFLFIENENDENQGEKNKKSSQTILQNSVNIFIISCVQIRLCFNWKSFIK